MKHNLAIIGLGGMGSWHVENVRKHIPQITVKGALDVRPEAYEKMAEMSLHPYQTLDELLSDPEIDLVTIATPNNFHKPLAIACLNAGKNVICEKPVALNSEELLEMMAAAKKNNRLFTVHQNRRWDGDYQTVRTILDHENVGRPYYVESRVQGSRRYLHAWRGYKIDGGGMIYDWGIHLFDQLLDAFKQKLTSVTCHAQSIYIKEVDDNFKAMLRFEDGLSALVEVGTNCFIPLPRWHVCCEDATFQIDDWEHHGKLVRLNTQRELEWGDDIVYTAAGPTRMMAPRPKQTIEECPLPTVYSDWSCFYKNVVAALEGKEELIVKPEQALRVMRLVDAAFESVRTGQSVAVNL